LGEGRDRSWDGLRVRATAVRTGDGGCLGLGVVVVGCTHAAVVVLHRGERERGGDGAGAGREGLSCGWGTDVGGGHGEETAGEVGGP